MKLSSKLIGKYAQLVEHVHWTHQNRKTRVPEWCKTILFSRRDTWEPFIRKDFKRFTNVNIEFGEITEDAVRRADIVVPYEFKDLVWLSERPWLTTHKRIPIPSKEVVDLCHNKRLFNKTLGNLGFDALIPDEAESPTPPFILKPNEGESSRDTFVITSYNSILRNADLLQRPGQLKQKLIVGKYEYATHMIVRAGELLADMTIEYRFENPMPIKGVDNFVWRRVSNCHDKSTLLEVLRRIGFEGICCFNYKLLNDKIQLIELNPRFGGSLSPHFSYLLSQIK